MRSTILAALLAALALTAIPVRAASSDVTPSEQQALEALERALQVEPKNPLTLINHGIVLNKLGQVGKAQDELRERLAFANPRAHAVYVRVAELADEGQVLLFEHGHRLDQ